MKRILFTTAYSKSSKNTWQYALRLAQHFGAQITLMHIYEDIHYPLASGHDFLDEDMLNNFDGFYDEERKEQYQKLDDFVTQNTPARFLSVPINYIVTIGDVGAAILQEEQETHYDLIILGTTKNRKVTNVLFGNTSLRVISKAQTPILLVPPIVEYKGVEKMVYATNFESGDFEALQQLMEWAQAFNAQLHLLHINNKTYEAQHAANKMQKLIAGFQKEEAVGITTTQIMEGNIAQSIQNYLGQTQADMIALTTHNRGFFARLFDPSVTNQIAAEALVPVLIFKER